jgi:hypothetical protein
MLKISRVQRYRHNVEAFMTFDADRTMFPAGKMVGDDGLEPPTLSV